MRPSFPNPNATHPQVKICGLTRLADAQVCAAAGVDAIGVNFWPKSKRYHPLAEAAKWLPLVPESLTRVAVLVNASAKEIEALWASGCVDALQFHGDESSETIQSWMSRGIPCLRAMALHDQADFPLVSQQAAKAILLDAFQPGVYGGTGQVADWPLAALAVSRFPEKQIILAGGLTVRNVAEAVKVVSPAAVDAASGVESAPGIKDSALVREFVRLAKQFH